jgi:hypothetical protein
VPRAAPKTGWARLPLRILVFAALATSLTLGAARAAEPWKEFRSAEGGFAVSFPGTPKTNVGAPNQTGPISHSFYVDAGPSSYVVMYIDYQPGTLSGKDPQGLFDSGRDNLVKGKKVKIRVDRKFTLADHPARKIVIEGADGSIQIFNLYLVKDRVYEVISGGPKGFDKSADAKRFNDSFRFIAQ